MLIYLLGMLYTTFICWSWGLAVWKLLQRNIGKGNLSQLTLPEQSLLGMIAIIVTGTLLNFWIPLNGWAQQLTLFLIASISFLRFSGYQSIRSEFAYYQKLPLTSKLLLILSLGLVLVMSTWIIIHPDSLAYHFPLVRWSADHTVTPGLANLHIRFGYQSNWFVGSAIFDTGSFGINGLSPLNGSILIWMVVFCVRQLNTFQLYEENKGRKFYWLLLLFMMGWSYTQFRLTATSASADFILAMLTWYILFLSINPSKEPLHRVLLIILISFAFTIKLSSAPLAILLFYFLFENKLILLKKYFWQTTLCVLIITIPFLVRNHISSGYLLFPVSFTSIGNPDWKVPAPLVEKEASYVTAYARLQVEGDMTSISEANKAGLVEWLPEWALQRSEADLTILTASLIILVIGFIKFKYLRHSSVAYKITLLTSLLGFCFWFYNAPDPRFGWGFIIGLAGLILYQLPTPAFLQKNEKLFLSTGLWILLSFGSAYLMYRAYNYSSINTWVVPAGIQPQKGTIKKIGLIDIFLPEQKSSCGNTALPCTYDSIMPFELRGEFLENGFRPIKSH